ncbi:hypothetical protein BBP40_005814 [Aspergillus hancockii]|nr:hypothetical protein BBP40_005814 [Aspergillus hancockii]
MQTHRLELVRLTKDHVPGYHAIWSDPVATRWSAHGACKTIDDSRVWMSSLLPDANPMGENYAILHRRSPSSTAILSNNGSGQGPMSENAYTDISAPGDFIGWIGTWRSDPVPELGFIFHQSTWGRGFATEALKAFIELFWRCKPEFNVLEAYCDTENEGSINVLRKCGFQLVEVAKGDYVLPWMTPSTRDTMQFRLVRPE